MNLASRIQEFNKDFGADILLSDATMVGLENDLNVEKLPVTKVKGKREPVQVYKLI